MSQVPIKLPKLSELPLKEGDPHHSAWGLYGKDDELGTLNRLTDEVVLRAARGEIRSGVRYATYSTIVCSRVETITFCSKDGSCGLSSKANRQWGVTVVMGYCFRCFVVYPKFHCPPFVHLRNRDINLLHDPSSFL